MTPLLRELGDLKRVCSAGQTGSIAERLFAEAWSRVLDGTDAWRPTVASALIAARLGDLTPGVLARAGLNDRAIADIRRHALKEIAADIDPALRDVLEGLAPPDPVSVPPPFVARLAAQPRAGVTCPGKPRLLFEPPENHAEHCLMVAVYGVLLSPRYSADPARVFLASLAHHLHNALLPDSGFTGEMLLGDALDPAMREATDIALAELPPPIRDAVVEARAMLPDADTPDGRAFHAADTLDRVLQIEQHLRAGRTTMHTVLHDMELVHAGPVKSFQDAVLAEYGLL